MQDHKSIEMNSNSQGTVLTFGVFDGVHVAHQKVINLVVDTAKKLALKSVVISFDPHPALSVLGEAPPALMTVNKKVELLKKLGVNEVIVEDFNKEFSQLSSEEFVKNILVDKFDVKKVVVGYDCAFGKNRAGNKKILKELGERYGFCVSILEPYKIDGEVVSSTRIRTAIMEGDLNLANRFLGRPYSISGLVVSGKGIGRNIGYATANIKPQPQILPPFGVYAVIVDIADTKRFWGILNIGVQPTFGKNKFQIEVHILDFKDELYNKSLDILLVKKIRDEIAFSSPEKLITQIKKDEEIARKILADVKY